ncbi:MAG: glutamyl-Q tRNA(Asp) synthetase [Lysobacteraceae bacterium]|nr:MAG: glutamyl-Q tRNA(Asp) synthetase [Xanthomonadaceae bacterium]
MRYRGRFAPSPTGPLHFGSLVAALGSWLDARAHGGEWLIRIEDVDRARERPGAAEAQLATLRRLGLVSDLPIVRQSQRLERYREVLARLVQSGRAFPCSCSRRELASSGGVHRRCLHPPMPARQAVRLRVEAGLECFEDRVFGRCCEDLARSTGDFVLLRADGFFAYQFAVVVDDADQGISDVVRGADLLASTARQRLLQRALGLPHPRTMHLPLVLDASGNKLAKSEGAQAIDREDPAAVLRRAWLHLGQEPSVLAGLRTVQAILAQAQRHWTPARVPPSWPPKGVTAPM